MTVFPGVPDREVANTVATQMLENFLGWIRSWSSDDFWLDYLRQVIAGTRDVRVDIQSVLSF